MERLKRMTVFAKVVEFGSFTAAARQLQMSVSSISQTVSKLEDELQVKLLNRSTRSIGLTEAGKIYYQGCRRMLHEVQDVHEQLYSFNNTPIGTLRIGCSSTMAQNVLANITSEILKEYPGLTVNLVTGIPAPDLIADGLDLVIRVGALQDSSLFSRRLGSMPMVLCAAKSYLQQAGIPEKPADLANHSWLENSVRPHNNFELIASEGITTRLSPHGRFVTNDPMTISRWLVAGGWWLVAGGWWLVAGGWWLVAGGWWLVAGGWWLVAGGWWLVAGGWWLVAGGWWLVAGGWWLVAGGWWLVAGGWWLVAGGWWLVAGGWWLVAGGWWLVAGGWWLVAGGWGRDRPRAADVGDQ